MRFAVILTFVLLTATGRTLAQPVGVRDLQVATAGRGKPVSAVVWYPAAPGGKPVIEGDNAVFHGVTALAGAPFAGQHLPVVVIAHGGFRAAPNAASWLASSLAASGFVAAVVTPPAIPDGPPSQAVLAELWLRPADLSATITALGKDAFFAQHIDMTKVAGVGFFLGGYSLLSLAGARLDPDAYRHSCDTVDRELDCRWFARGKLDLSRIDESLLARSNLDPRLKLAIVSAPELSEFLSDASLRAIAIPVRIIDLSPLDDAAGARPGSELEVQNPRRSRPTH